MYRTDIMMKLVAIVLVLLVIGYSAKSEKSDREGGCLQAKSATEAFECGAGKTLKFFDNLESRQKLQLLPGITLLSSSNSSEIGRALEQLRHLPNNPSERRDKLMELVLGAVSRFTSGRTLQLNLDKLTRENLARAIEEGRGKDKKSPMPWVIAGIGLVLLLVPAALGVLAVLATKALVVGKMSLLLSLISFAQYFFASSGGKNVVPSVYATKYVGTYGPPADNGWNGYEPGPAYRRSFAVRTEDSTYANQ